MTDEKQQHYPGSLSIESALRGARLSEGPDDAGRVLADRLRESVESRHSEPPHIPGLEGGLSDRLPKIDFELLRKMQEAAAAPRGVTVPIGAPVEAVLDALEGVAQSRDRPFGSPPIEVPGLTGGGYLGGAPGDVANAGSRSDRELLAKMHEAAERDHAASGGSRFTDRGFFQMGRDVPSGGLLDPAANREGEGIRGLSGLAGAEAVAEKVRGFTREQRARTFGISLMDREVELLRMLRAMLTEPHRLSRPDVSAFHKLVHALQTGEARNIVGERSGMLGTLVPPTDGDPSLARESAASRTFLMWHDWAAAFRGAGDFDRGEYRLPFPKCVFEFVINGRRTVALISDATGGRSMMLWVSLSDTWMLLGSYVERNDGAWHACDDGERWALSDTIGRQVRAACIVLGAKVAEVEVQRAPHRLNQARVKAGKLPIHDHHLVKLARRRRVLPRELEPDHEPGTRRRCHFVRGHDRHYATHKTWIEWHLRGDPDLGFVDKDYAL